MCRPTEVVNGTGSAPAPTTLRIKLVDPKTATSKPSTPQEIPAIGRGAGSKNLSRMNRPQDETSKGKAVTQIPINVFWNQVEAFFKPLEDADMNFLCDPSRIIDPTPFTIPPLGRPFLEQWKEQYGYVSSSAASKNAAVSVNAFVKFKPTLKERLLSLLIDEELPETQEDVEMEGPEEEEAGRDSSPSPEDDQMFVPSRIDYVHLDERLRHELAASGIEEFANCSIDFQEDDAICTELRQLQRQLQEQVAVNYYRKRKLSDLAKAKLPAQEFYSLLSDLDKQLEQVFLKRSKSGKKKKKTSGGSGGGGTDTPLSTTVPTEAVRMLENRAKLMVAFEPYIPKLSQFLASEDAHIVDKTDESNIVKIAQETGNWLPIPSHHEGAQQAITTEFTRSLPVSQPVFPK